MPSSGLCVQQRNTSMMSSGKNRGTTFEDVSETCHRHHTETAARSRRKLDVRGSPEPQNFFLARRTEREPTADKMPLQKQGEVAPSGRVSKRPRRVVTEVATGRRGRVGTVEAVRRGRRACRSQGRSQGEVLEEGLRSDRNADRDHARGWGQGVVSLLRCLFVAGNLEAGVAE